MHPFFIKSLMLWCLWIAPLFSLEELNIRPFMEENINKSTEILRSTTIAKESKAPKVFALFDPIFDYGLMAKIALGSTQWATLSPEEQTRFTIQFEQRLKRSYVEKLDLYTDEKIVIKALQKIKENRIQLTIHLLRNAEVYEIVYKFYPHQTRGWLVYDVDVLGVSIIQTYRTQFADILSKNSFEILLQKLQ